MEEFLLLVRVVLRVLAAVGLGRVLAVPVHDHTADGVVEGGLRADVKVGEALVLRLGAVGADAGHVAPRGRAARLST